MRIGFEYRLKSGRRLDGVTGGDLAYSVAQTIKSGGKIRIVNPPAADWLNESVSITAVVDTERVPLGVFLVSAPVADYGATGVSMDLELADKLSILDADAFGATFSLPAGTNAVDAVVSLIQGAGQTDITANDGSEVLANGMFWEAGTSRLRVINDLLDASGYFSLWCDGQGFYRIDKYTRPQDRGVTSRFDYGQTNQLVARDQDIYSIPNRFIAIGSADPESGALTATAENTNADSPYSYPARGRWITQVEEGVEVTSQSVLNAYAERRLQEVSSVSASVEVEHLVRPLLLNDAVRVTHMPTGLDALHTVQRIEIPLDPLGLCRSTLREVVETG